MAKKPTDYEKLRCALYHILSGKHEDGTILTIEDAQNIARIALKFTSERAFSLEYGRKRGAI